MAIRNSLGADIAPDLIASAETAGIPLELALGCAIAESGLNPYAERWGGGSNTAAAKTAIEQQNWGALQAVINRVGADISFGYGQQIVLYHYLGDRSATVENCLAVREAVFGDPSRNLWDMAKRLAARLQQARRQDLDRVDGDELLGACVIYNRGHWPVDAAEWTAIKSRVDHYRRSLVDARRLIAAHEGAQPMTDIERRANEESIKDKLGAALTGEMPASECVVKAYENAALLYIPGAGTYLLPEGTVADKFRSAPGE